MQKFLLSIGTVMFSGSALAGGLQGLRHTLYYIGFNSGASIATFQGSDYFSDTQAPPPYQATHRNEVSARGYNGGLFLGYNFYCCGDFLLGLEFSGNLYSNRGYYSINFYNATTSTYSAYEISFDVDFSVHAAFRPQYIIDDSTLVYGLIGAGYSDINVRAANLVQANVRTNQNPVDNRESTWGLTLGVGLQHRISCHTNVFAGYEFTQYRNICLNDVLQSTIPRAPVSGAFRNRGAYVDTNVLKMGFLFTF